MSRGFTNVQESKKNDSEKEKVFGTDTQQQTLYGIKKNGTLCQKIKDNPQNNKQPAPTLSPKIMELASKNEYTKNMINEQNLYGFLILANILKIITEKEITNVELSEDLKRTQEMVTYFKSQLPQNYAKDINEIEDMANIPIEYLQRYLEYLRNTENPLDTDIKLSPMLEAYIQTKLLQKSDINTDTRVRINSMASKRLYTKEDHQQQIQDALEIKAQLENPAMMEIEKFDCFWNVGIIKYPNIYHKGAYLIYDSKINTEKLICYEERMIFKNGAGAKIPPKIYDDIIEYLQKNSPNVKPTTQQIDAIKNHKFFAGIFQNKDIETSMLTGLDNHVSLFVADPNNPDYAYHIGTFTSSKNEGTIQLSSCQEFNADPFEAKKVQGFRPARVLIRVNRQDIVDHADAHKFVHGYNRDNEYVPQKINLLAQKAQDFWLNHKILDNISVDLKFLQELALKKLDQIISDCTDILKKKATYNTKRQQREEEDAKKQKENHLKKQILQQKIDSLSSTDTLLFKINDELKAKIKKKIFMDSHIIPKIVIPNNDNEETS